VAAEGVDFAQDTQQGGADEFDFITNTEEVLVDDVISSEFIPDSLEQKVEVVDEDAGRGISGLVEGRAFSADYLFVAYIFSLYIINNTFCIFSSQCYN
jgi:hypothetical protein